jgi:hypothetical protein
VLAYVDWELLLATGSIDDLWDRFTDKISIACKENIPVCKSKPKHYDTPWMDKGTLSPCVFHVFFIFERIPFYITTAEVLSICTMFSPLYALYRDIAKTHCPFYPRESQSAKINRNRFSNLKTGDVPM